MSDKFTAASISEALDDLQGGVYIYQPLSALQNPHDHSSPSKILSWKRI